MREWWRAGYTITVQGAKETRSVRVEIDDISSFECPKSRILRNPASSELIQIVGQAASMRGALGPAVRWPANFYDAYTVISRAKADDEAARKAAIAKG